MSDTQSDGAQRQTPPPSVSRSLRGIEAIRLAKEYLEEFTGKPCEQASGLATTEDGWIVVLEVVELERLPSSTDILGSYVVKLDQQGELIGYERAGRYCRSQVRGQSTDHRGAP